MKAASKKSEPNVQENPSEPALSETVAAVLPSEVVGALQDAPAVPATPATAAVDVPAQGTSEGKLDPQAEAAVINELHEAISRSDSDNLTKAIEVGRRCAALKAHLKQEKAWMRWVEDHLKFSSRTANNYIVVFEAHSSGKLKETTLSAAYFALGVLKGERKARSSPKPAPFEFYPRMAADKLQKRIDNAFVSQKTMPTVVVQGSKPVERRRSLNKAMKEHAEEFLQKGGVIIVPPVDVL